MGKRVLLILVFLCAVSVQAAMKSVAAPYIKNAQITLDGKLYDPCWQKSEIVEDFVLHGAKNLTSEKGEARFFTDGEYLYVAVKSFQKTADICSTPDKNNLWLGDVIELIFGSLTLDNDYRYHIAVSPANDKFAANLAIDNYESATAIGDNFWAVEFKIPLKNLKFIDHATKFNIGCYKKNENKQLVWAHVGSRYKGIERFGELILGSYNSALSAKFSYFADKVLNRSEYEELYQTLHTPAWQIQYGPYLHGVASNNMTVSWKTYSQVQGRVLYREKGKKNYISVPSNLQYAVTPGNYTRHHAHLKNLAPGKTYEYLVQTFDFYSEKWMTVAENLSFTTFDDKKENFSFTVFTDFHGQGKDVKHFMELEQTKNADFVVNLGDMIDYADYQADFYSEVVVPQSEFAKNKPIVHIRGNHETYGYAAASFFEVFPHYSGRSYYTFSYGKVFFVALDCGDDRPFADMIKLAQEQNAFLREVVQSDEFKNADARVILCHMPLIDESKRYSKRMNIILKDVFIGEKPLAEIDLLIAGHTHMPSITRPDSDTALIYGLNPASIKSPKLPFAVICNGGRANSMLYVQKVDNSLKVDIIGKNGDITANYEVKLQVKK